MSREERLAEEVRALARLDLEGLRAEWRRRYDAPPKLRSAGLLARILSWRIQADQFGGIDPATRRVLINSKAPTRPKVEVQPGVRLIREWQGRRIEVQVVAQGVVYEGKTYASLSEVARLITGVRWNGPRFFGLRSQEGRAA